MLPAIGVMIAAYIVTRMIELIGRKDRGTGIKVIACITILVTIISVVDILNAGSRVGGLS